MMRFVFGFGILMACGETEKTNTSDKEGMFLVDNDGDGFLSGEDCDDTNPTINPEAQDSFCE